MEDPYDLERFVVAQGADDDYEDTMAELRSGRKVGHWMWFVFPQVAGLGLSARSRRFAVGSLEEARAYLRHDLLGPRLMDATSIVSSVRGRTAAQIFGSTDAMKLRSCMTLFLRADPSQSCFRQILDTFFDGAPDLETDRILKTRDQHPA